MPYVNESAPSDKRKESESPYLSSLFSSSLLSDQLAIVWISSKYTLQPTTRTVHRTCSVDRTMSDKMSYQETMQKAQLVELEMDSRMETSRASSTFRPPSKASQRVRTCVNSRPALIGIILQSIFPMVSLAIAISNIRRCAAQPTLPIWLICYSLVHIVVAALRIVAHYRNNLAMRIASGVAGLVAVGLVIMGIVLVSWKWNSVTFDEIIFDQFCDPWLWRISIIHAFIGTLVLSCVPLCCLGCLAADHFCTDWENTKLTRFARGTPV
ncbi:hypothetical protein PRIPAC_97413 [Pristionchus pacificus]|uniref:Uncharacterized protein n=1 Tax=Pristionchus pacificus TaxID=54126 RepID=A0A2A6B2K7_PRIPA|nr:hypothetical protein PRIPAC_97413 [Pristionchus pacificus]|eukprot:PDM60101.1 hypothetical protein PRIPAC_49387 [Pristionchus pacificus]